MRCPFCWGEVRKTAYLFKKKKKWPHSSASFIRLGGCPTWSFQSSANQDCCNGIRLLRNTQAGASHAEASHSCCCESRGYTSNLKFSGSFTFSSLSQLCVCVPRPPLPANFTGDPPFHLNDVRGTGKAKSSKNSLSALQLVHLQDGSRFFEVSLGCSNICCDLKHTQLCYANFFIFNLLNFDFRVS